MPREEVQIVGGPTVTADLTSTGLLALHRAPRTGFVLTHVPTGRVVVWSRRKGPLRSVQRRLEALDWTDLDAVATEVRTISIAEGTK